MVGIFRRKINLILSLGITILVAATPLFSTIATLLGQYGAYTALIAFAIVFVIGIGAWVFRRGREYVTGSLDEERGIEKEIKKLQDKLDRESDPRKRVQLARELSELRRIREEFRYNR